MTTSRHWNRTGTARQVVVALVVIALAAFVTGCSKAATPKASKTPAASTSTTPTTASTSAAPASNTSIPTYNVYVKNFTYHGMPSSVPANTPFLVSFTNKEAFPVLHEFVVLKLTGNKTVADVVNDAKKKGPKAEDDWIHVGDSGDPLPVGASTVVSMDLKPGKYVATCWQTGKAGGGSGPPHVAIGMHAAFTASTSAPVPNTPAPPVYNVFAKNFSYHGMPATVPANQPIMVSFTNKEAFPIDHEYVVLKLTGNKTEADIVKDAKKKGPNAEDDWIHVGDSGDPLPVGGTTVVTMDLAPGKYVATCWQTGKAGGGSGPPHVAIGMHVGFTAVAGATATPATLGQTYNVYVKNFTYHGMAATVPANTLFHVSFTNEESFSIVHEFVVVRIPPGKTAADIVNDTKKKGPKGEDDWVHVGDSGDVNTNDSTVLTMDLPPGHYMAACWQTGKAGGGSGPPHITIGMHTEFTAQ